MILAVLCLSSSLIVFLYYIHLRYTYWTKRNVPHPPVSYLFGNLRNVILLKKSLGQFCNELYSEYTNFPFIGFYRAQTPCLLIRDLELVEEVIVKSFNSFRDNDVNVDEERDPLFVINPFFGKGQTWKVNRSRSVPSFTAKRVKEMYPLMEAAAKNLVNYINSNVIGSPKGIDAKEMSFKYTTDVVISCALGLEANSFVDSNSEYIKMMNKIFYPTLLNNIKFLSMSIFPSLSKFLKLKIIPDEVGEYYKNVVSNTLKYRTEKNIKRGDFLDSMHELQQKLGTNTFSNDDITAHALTFFTDGTETSAIVFSFTLYELAVHLDVQQNLRREIEETILGNNGQLNYDVIQSVEYLDKVINKSLRKNTPVSIMTRICTEQITFQSPYCNGESVIIETGTPVVIPIHSIHHDPKYYADPSSFDPTRFSDNNLDARLKYAYLPFGEGPRICLGQRFGIGQIKVGLVNLIKNFEIRISKLCTVPYEIDPQYFLLAAKGGIRLEFFKLS